jgi:hypothetical protein
MRDQEPTTIVRREPEKLKPLIRRLTNQTVAAKSSNGKHEHSQNESKREIFGALWLGRDIEQEQTPMGALDAG